MRSLRLSNLLLLGTLLLWLPARAGDNAAVYRQSYAILLKGSLAGSETVTESIDGAGNILSSSDHEIFISDGIETKRMAFATKMQMAKNTYAPITYSYKYTTGDEGDFYEVTVKNAQILRKLTRNGHASEVTVPFLPNTVIVDFNVYHQYDYVLRQYDVTKGGRQVFRNFVPLIGTDIPLAITSLGEGELKLGNGAIAVSNYRIEFTGIAGGTLSVDKNRRLVRLVLPTQDLEVVRKDLLPADAGN
jgi:hypothetical protein